VRTSSVAVIAKRESPDIGIQFVRKTDDVGGIGTTGLCNFEVCRHSPFEIIPMKLSDRINNDLKAAMKAGEKIRLETLRSIRASFIELEKSGKETISEEDQLKAVINQAKRRKDAIEQYDNAGRADLADRERVELEVIEEYLPKQLTEDEIRAEVAAIISQTKAAGPQDFKVVMPRAMASMRGRADGSRVQQIVREQLEAAGG
jgi:hypothetical protein